MTAPTKAQFYDAWVQHIMKMLFQAEMGRLDKSVNQLCEKQTTITGEACFGFLYQAIRHIPKQYAHMNQPRLPTLHITLSEELFKYGHDRENVFRDWENIRQIFIVLLRKATSAQDVRNAIPDCVANIIPELGEYTRTAPIDLSLGGRFFEEEFKKWLPKIEMYSVTHLIY